MYFVCMANKHYDYLTYCVPIVYFKILSIKFLIINLSIIYTFMKLKFI